MSNSYHDPYSDSQSCISYSILISRFNFIFIFRFIAQLTHINFKFKSMLKSMSRFKFRCVFGSIFRFLCMCRFLRSISRIKIQISYLRFRSQIHISDLRFISHIQIQTIFKLISWFKIRRCRAMHIHIQLQIHVESMFQSIFRSISMQVSIFQIHI